MVNTLAAPLEVRERELDKVSAQFIDYDAGDGGQGLLVKRELGKVVAMDGSASAAWATGLHLVQELDRKTGLWKKPEYLFIRYRWLRHKDIPKSGFWKAQKQMRMAAEQLRVLLGQAHAQQLWHVEAHHMQLWLSEKAARDRTKNLKNQHTLPPQA
jgi:hypothetical protein